MAEAAGSPPQVTIIAQDIGPIGGMERQLTELICGLLRDGYRVVAVSRTCDLPAHEGLRWVRVRGPARPFALAYPWFFLLASLLTRLRGRGPIHSTGAIVLNRVDICTVHFCHQAVAELPGFSRASRPGLAYRLNAGVSRRMSRLAERWCYRRGRAGRLIGVSQGVERELQRYFPAMRERIGVIPNGVDIAAFHPAEPAPPSQGAERLRVLFVGSEWERKGLRPAIAALAQCPVASLTVLGQGDRDSYRRYAEEVGVGDRVRFAGATADVPPWYRQADVFLLPTAYETFSLVTYEAAASGLPLLVSRVNGVEDILEEGVNGWFVDRDPERIAERLRALAADPVLRVEMGRRAREASLPFSWAAVVERYRDLYRELGPGPARA